MSSFQRFMPRIVKTATETLGKSETIERRTNALLVLIFSYPLMMHSFCSYQKLKQLVDSLVPASRFFLSFVIGCSISLGFGLLA